MEKMKGGSFFYESVLKKFLGLNCSTKYLDVLSSRDLQYKILMKYYDIKRFELNVDDNFLRDKFILNSFEASDTSSWKAVRKKLHLPVRGQSTRTNARTGKKLRSKDFFKVKEEENIINES